MILRNLVIVALSCLSFFACTSPEKVKEEQYFVEGHQLYQTYCANCHSSDGKGLQDLYPPLNRKDPLPSKADFACIVKNGLSDSITIDGKVYNRKMPANPKLTDIEIAEIATYVYKKWGNDTTYTTIYDIKTSLSECQN